MDWLTTIVPLVDPMIARQAIEDAQTIDALDFDHEVICECESPEYYCSVTSHLATLWGTKPCGEMKAVCSSVRAVLESFEADCYYVCDTCGQRHGVHDHTWAPLDMS